MQVSIHDLLVSVKCLLEEMRLLLLLVAYKLVKSDVSSLLFLRVGDVQGLEVSGLAPRSVFQLLSTHLNICLLIKRSCMSLPFFLDLAIWVCRGEGFHVSEFLSEFIEHFLGDLELNGSGMVLDRQGILGQVLDDGLVLRVILTLTHLKDHVFVRTHLLAIRYGVGKFEVLRRRDSLLI